MRSRWTSRAVRSTSGQDHQPQVTTDERQEQNRVDGQGSTGNTMRQKVGQKWIDLKTFCCRRRDSIELQRSEDSDLNRTSEIFTVSSQLPPPRIPDRILPQYRGTDLSRPKKQIPATEADVAERKGQVEDDSGTAQIVFGRERPRVLAVLQRRTAALYVYIKQKFHTRTLHIKDTSCQEQTTDVQPRLASTQISTSNVSLLAVDRDSSSYKLKAERNQKMMPRSDRDEPVQNVAQESIFLHTTTTERSRH